ncbi:MULTISPECIES: hypothetical protein [unclassified Pseudomonas]|uniref:hypothetical protein n=1 Tax=unclassified Pseudomonas TaxID=196821 RepID=UPI00353204CB
MDKARPRLDGRGRLTARRRIAIGLGHQLQAQPGRISPKRHIMHRDDARQAAQSAHKHRQVVISPGDAQA